MREKYVSPAILFESFALSQTIARACAVYHTSTLGESTHYNESTCTWDVGGYTIFFPDHCDDGPDSPEDDYEIDIACYNNPDGGDEIFSST